MTLNNPAKKKQESGQALIELIVAIMLATIVLTSLIMTIISTREALSRNKNLLTANLLLQKESEAVRSVKEANWNSIASLNPNLQYHTELFGNAWRVSPVQGTVVENGLTRSFKVTTLCRLVNGSGPPTETCGGLYITDPSVKKITVTVSWSGLGSQSISSSFFISRYSNNGIWSQTTAAEFNAGTRNCSEVSNTAGGEVRLASSPSGNWSNPFTNAIKALDGNQKANATFATCNRAYIVTDNRAGHDFFVYDTTVPTNLVQIGSTELSSNGNAIIVVGNFAYIATSDNSRELIIVNLATYTIAGSRNTPSSSADANSVAVVGSKAYIVTGNNSGANPEYYEFDVTNPVISSPPTRTLDLTAAANEISISGNYAYIAMSNTTELRVVDTNTGLLAGSKNITTNSANALSVFALGTTAYLAAASNLYILDVSNPSSIPNPPDPFNANGTINSVYVLGNLAFLSNNQVNSQFKVVTITNPASPTLRGSSNLNDNAHGVFVTGTLAFVATDANANELVELRGGEGVAGFHNTGTFESRTFDCNSPTLPAAACVGFSAGFNYLAPDISEVAGTELKYQIATNNDGSTWNFVGPNGTPSTFFDNASFVNLPLVSARYFRFKIFLSGNGVASPYLNSFIVNYSP